MVELINEKEVLAVVERNQAVFISNVGVATGARHRGPP